jgi:hypothetical protein
VAYRAFTDSTGVQWNVWAVVPQWADRRAGRTRRTKSIDEDDVDPPVLEQRRVPDRRQGLPDQFPRIRLNGGLDGGWLAFESSGERRRLCPIPSDWEEATDVELEQMCRGATPAAAPRRVIE